ncbi:spore coat protein A [Sphaerisporangium rufum]|uniref:Spore coat protein A n=1 Tax=Sphaerisporangium rufum TaxID=1381558 RepID=A0A919QX00_9ACTN|nr:multicopper oxidase domain-containing protein [Sphaerisporangium rufum]GII75393.1 spore coat protein A [Sphaerisporangium rufum]
MLGRREVLRLAGAAALSAPALAACGDGGPFERGASAGGSTGRLLRSQAHLPAPFTVPLPVPPVLKPVRSDGAADHYEITQRAAAVEILPGLQTEIWGYDGRFPGPTIESRRGRRTVVTHRNTLAVPTVVHLHGGKTPAEHDGYPTDVIRPGGAAKEYVYPLDQPAATLWYHDHRMDFTGPQVYRGLAGFHLVRDDEEEALPLPKGEREIPLLIGDRAFAADGSLRYPALDPALRDRPGVEEAYRDGVLGDVILVNGAPWPRMAVSAARYRLRFLNGSNARRYRLALDPPPPSGPAFVQIGSDAGLLPAPAGHARIDIAPAERFDVVVDFSAYPVGTKVRLANEFGEGNLSHVMRFDVVRKAADDSRVPSRLVAAEPVSRRDAVANRKFLFGRGVGGHGEHRQAMWTVNGKPFDTRRADARVRLGTTEVWRIIADVHHPVHLHLAHFQILSRNGRGPRATDRGWKDTIDLGGSEVAEILVRFTGYRGRYVMHCHNLEHEDMMMMSNFDVV